MKPENHRNTEEGWRIMLRVEEHNEGKCCTACGGEQLRPINTGSTQ